MFNLFSICYGGSSLKEEDLPLYSEIEQKEPTKISMEHPEEEQIHLQENKLSITKMDKKFNDFRFQRQGKTVILRPIFLNKKLAYNSPETVNDITEMVEIVRDTLNKSEMRDSSKVIIVIRRKNDEFIKPSNE